MSAASGKIGSILKAVLSPTTIGHQRVTRHVGECCTSEKLETVLFLADEKKSIAFWF